MTPRSLAPARPVATAAHARARPAATAALALAAVLAVGGCAPQDGLAASGTPIGTVATSQAVTGTGAPPTGAPPTAPRSSASTPVAGLGPCPSTDPSVAPVAGGLPDLTLACLGEGPAVRLAGLRGTPSVVNVWASWCGPCRQELPAMARVSSAAGGTVRFLGVDLSDAPDAAAALARESGVRYPSVRDDDAAFRAAARPPVTGLPVTYFVRADGTVAARVDGAIDDPQRLRDLIATHLGVSVPA